MPCPFIRSFVIWRRSSLVLSLLYLLCACENPSIHDTPLAAITAAPKILGPGIISTTAFHESINAISKRQDTVYFSRADKGFGQSTLLLSSFANGNWETPDTLPFSGNHYDAGLNFSPDQTTAFFTSKRPPKEESLSRAWNIWRVQIKNQSWGTPEVLEYPINSDSSECCLSMNGQGDTYFASNRSGSWDIYYAQYSDESFTQVSKISDSLNTSAGEWPSYIDDAGAMLIFSSIRDTGLGGDDIYVSEKNSETWSAPKLLAAPINSSSYEDSPLLTPDGKVLLFSSWRETELSKGMSNIYVAAWPGLSQ